MKYKILVVDDELLLRLTLEGGLSDLGYQVRSAADIQTALREAEQFRPQVILLDNRLGEARGMEYIEEFRQLDEDILIILMTAYGSINQAVEAMKKGAGYYVTKPFDLDEIDLTIRRGMEQLLTKRSLALMRHDAKKFLGISPAICRIRREIEILASNDNVDALVCGETGTGKEVVVDQIHHLSPRRNKPLVKLNCSAIPESLLESELFGYEKGAFTGAQKSKKGLMELANEGTIFLDEIGEMPMPMQAKLLRFLEDRTLRRIGGLRDIEVNLRVIAATNRHLEECVRDGSFREDLYYRLNVMQINLPPLRERTEDIPILCEEYLDRFNHKFGKSIKGISEEFMQRLQAYPWKGNVRELRNVIERCVLFARGEYLTGEEEVLPLKNVGKAPCGHDSYPMADLSKTTINLRREVEQFERQYIERALLLTGGNMSRAAELLGCTRFSLKRRLEEKQWSE